jgi:hypothetical protein
MSTHFLASFFIAVHGFYLQAAHGFKGSFLKSIRGEQKDADAARSAALCLFVARTLISQKVDFSGDALTAHK